MKLRAHRRRDCFVATRPGDPCLCRPTLADPGGGAPRSWPPQTLNSRGQTMFWPPLNRPEYSYLSTKMLFFGVFEVQSCKIFFRIPMSHRNWMFPLVTYFYVFFETEFGSIPKNSGLNPWGFQFWGYPRLGPRPKLASLKPAAGSASVARHP